MHSRQRSVLGYGFSTAVILALGASGVFAADGSKAGIAAAVRGNVQQILFSAPSQVGRNVATGDPIHLGDRIATDNMSGLQIMLQDQTTFTIGPNSSLTIDEFVYDPATQNGKLTATIRRGTFRFISGKIAEKNPDGMTVKLPVATIGVRGTTAMGETDGTDARIALAGQGENNNIGRPASRLMVRAGDVEQIIYRTGFFVEVGRNGVPTSPARVPPALQQKWGETLAGLRTGDGKTIDRNREESGRGDVDRSRVRAATGQGLAEALGPARLERNLQRVADEKDRRARGDHNLQQPFGVYSFNSPVVPMIGTATATYQFKYVVDFDTRKTYGEVKITTADDFTPGTGTFALVKNPLVERNIALREFGSVPGLPGDVLVDYRLTKAGINNRVVYREGTLIAAGQDLTPGVRVK